MGALEILLLLVVGFSVLVFLILDSLEQSRKTCDSESKTRLGSSASVHQEEEKSVGADGEAEKQLVSESFKKEGFEETAHGEETENLVNASDEKSDFYKNRGIREDDGEGEEEFIEDWEDIERSELEKIFGEAIVFVSCNKGNGDGIEEDVKLQLYGLQKVALEGPCHGSQPMALMVSARSKWSAWQKLGNMSREMAMKKYIDILSEAIPEWKGEGTLAIQDAASFQDLTTTPLDSKYGAEAER